MKKLSIWSIIILVATVISLGLLVTSIALTAIGVPGILAVAKQTAIDQGVPEADVALVVNIALITVIVALVLASIFDILKIIGGFMFSLKGRWGIFCIVVAIISVISTLVGLINDITNKASIGTIIVSVVSILVSAIYCFACFKHKAELAKEPQPEL